MVLLPPLDVAEVRDFCRRYHCTFEPEVVEALLARRTPGGPSWGNALSPVLAVEELNLLDTEDSRTLAITKDYGQINSCAS